MRLTRFLLVLALAAPTFAQNTSSKTKSVSKLTPEQRTAKYMESIRTQPPLLRGFLYAMPKGGDLHNHLSGSIYAENHIARAANAGLCVNLATLTFVPPKQVAGEPNCEDKTQRPATDALRDPGLYSQLIDAFSLRNHSPARKPGEYQFFDTFLKFDAVTKPPFGAMLAEVAHRAALQNEHYLELIYSLDGGVAWALADKTPWHSDADLAGYRQRLLDAGLTESTKKAKAMIDEAEAAMHRELKCGTPNADVGCDVQLRYIAQILRAFSKERVFAQTAAGFEIANSDKRVVGINMVQPEDWLVPMRDYDLHMRMVGYLHNEYPKVNITLHAGELTFGQVPPEELGRHVPRAIDTAHAQRIGHGTDVMYYLDAENLLKEMAQKRIAVEVSLSSSDMILGIRGPQHPFRHYLQAGVPVVIATDDEGVSRSDITQEYQRTAEEQSATYAELKRISRNSAEYSFLPGQSLWADATSFKVNEQCAKESPAKKTSQGCADFLQANEKAREQWKLEQRFAVFEGKW
ncbi:MAG: adenosine deaminase [Acidobacteriales bacterium]|nr:adenosine deaminase [Terriglobales bacterium]